MGGVWEKVGNFCLANQIFAASQRWKKGNSMGWGHGLGRTDDRRHSCEVR